MPTLFTHPIFPLAVGLGLGREVIPRPVLVAGAVAAMLPDLDVLAFRFGVPYAAAFGHRGFSHSLLFAVLLGLLGAIMLRRAGFGRAFVFIALSAASHGVLDAFTNGGLGVAFLWPWSEARFFAPYQVIQVSPIGLSRFLSPRGAAVMVSEMTWVWLPAAVLGFLLAMVSRAAPATTPPPR